MAVDDEATREELLERGDTTPNGKPDGVTVDYKKLGSLTPEETARLLDEDAASVFDGKKWVEADAAVRSNLKPEAQTVKDNTAKLEQYDPNPELPPLPDKSQEEKAANHTKLGTP